jgi:hypothetical protein
VSHHYHNNDHKIHSSHSGFVFGSVAINPKNQVYKISTEVVRVASSLVKVIDCYSKAKGTTSARPGDPASNCRFCRFS